MGSTYYDSTLTADEIDTALKATATLSELVTPANNGKVLAVVNGEIVAKPVTDYVGAKVLVPKTITENGTYNPASDNADGYNSVTVNVPVADGYVISPVLRTSTFVARTATTYTGASLTLTANQVAVITIEVRNYTGEVTIDDLEHFAILYSDNSTGSTRMILTNNGELDDTAVTVTIDSEQYIRYRCIVLDNVSGAALLRSNAQSTPQSSKVTVDNLPEGYTLYVCFDNHASYNHSRGDILEEWHCRWTMMLPYPVVSSSDDWPNTGVIMPASIFIKMSQLPRDSVLFSLPYNFSSPNVCELALTMA